MSAYSSASFEEIRWEDYKQFNPASAYLIAPHSSPTFHSKQAIDPVSRDVGHDFRKLLNNCKYSDVQFVLEGKTVFAHKNILSARCEKFELLFLDLDCKTAIGALPQTMLF